MNVNQDAWKEHQRREAAPMMMCSEWMDTEEWSDENLDKRFERI
jgi:hypothetical protein